MATLIEPRALNRRSTQLVVLMLFIETQSHLSTLIGCSIKPTLVVHSLTTQRSTDAVAIVQALLRRARLDAPVDSLHRHGSRRRRRRLLLLRLLLLLLLLLLLFLLLRRHRHRAWNIFCHVQLPIGDLGPDFHRWKTDRYEYSPRSRLSICLSVCID